jgi:hypothetical protein
VKLVRPDAFVSQAYPPDGESEQWWQRLNQALGTVSSDFVNASLLQVQAAARSPFGKISQTGMNAALVGSRHPNSRLAKIHRCYSVEETALFFRIHKNTVRIWIKQGLSPIDGQRPTMIRGDEIRRFLGERRVRAKRPCGPGRIYCLPCRAPKVPAGNMAECVAAGDTNGTLQGICPDCDRMIYRKVNPQKLAAVRGDLDISVTQAGLRIEETTKPNVNCDSTEGDNR